MLHALDKHGGLRSAQQALDVLQTSAEAHAAHARPAAIALGALCELVCVLGALAGQSPPLA